MGNSFCNPEVPMSNACRDDLRYQPSCLPTSDNCNSPIIAPLEFPSGYLERTIADLGRCY